VGAARGTHRGALGITAAFEPPQILLEHLASGERGEVSGAEIEPIGGGDEALLSELRFDVVCSGAVLIDDRERADVAACALD
jgi:hypothetical protein